MRQQQAVIPNEAAVNSDNAAAIESSEQQKLFETGSMFQDTEFVGTSGDCGSKEEYINKMSDNIIQVAADKLINQAYIEVSKGIVVRGTRLACGTGMVLSQ